MLSILHFLSVQRLDNSSTSKSSSLLLQVIKLDPAETLDALVLSFQKAVFFRASASTAFQVLGNIFDTSYPGLPPLHAITQVELLTIAFRVITHEGSGGNSSGLIGQGGRERNGNDAGARGTGSGGSTENCENSGDKADETDQEAIGAGEDGGYERMDVDEPDVEESKHDQEERTQVVFMDLPELPLSESLTFTKLRHPQHSSTFSRAPFKLYHGSESVTALSSFLANGVLPGSAAGFYSNQGAPYTAGDIGYAVHYAGRNLAVETMCFLLAGFEREGFSKTEWNGILRDQILMSLEVDKCLVEQILDSI
ncbi:hypothetical protein BJ508DRAFT_334123 [Ascobolus immersus RN42]|uniref:Uncharacterized protein n=1 Tax=Ascobolus immersus RN42 TaxID=1160509 RepID=A0A3N4HH32_ASCIM|nr:hypothetical protein BJ508DRAFT_334123 [Ascobolus immersus RN42]